MIESTSKTLLAFLSTSKGYMMENATNEVVEGKMEPIDKQQETRPLLVTGQYLYDTFMDEGEAGTTRMAAIRSLVEKDADALQIKGACDKLVEIAKEKDKAAGVPEKVWKDGKEVVNRGPKTQTAMNTRTVIQQAWGALKFAPTKLAELGYKDTTGYNDMRVLAKKALDAAKVDWKGAHALTEADKERKQAQKATKAETAILQQVQKDNPRDTTESLADWNMRTFQLAQDAMQEEAEKSKAAAVDAAFERLTKELDENQLYNLVVKLQEFLPFEIGGGEGEEEQPIDNNTPAEPVTENMEVHA